jgi:hypothetical protein
LGRIEDVLDRLRFVLKWEKAFRRNDQRRKALLIHLNGSSELSLTFSSIHFPVVFKGSEQFLVGVPIFWKNVVCGH